MSWDRRFSDPVVCPTGVKFTTLREAGAYIAGLPSSQHGAPEWQAAMHVLIQAADHCGPMEFARLGMMQALYPKPEPVYHSAKKDPKERNSRMLARDR